MMATGVHLFPEEEKTIGLAQQRRFLLMWLFTSQGMLSVVAHRDIPNSLMVRAKSRSYYEIISGADVKLTVTQDYAYRTVIDRSYLLYS